MKGTSKNVIPVKTGIQKPLISLDSRLRGSDKLVIMRGSLKFTEQEKGSGQPEGNAQAQSMTEVNKQLSNRVSSLWSLSFQQNKVT